MCMIDNLDSYWSWSDTKQQAARIQHRCGECGRTIQPGEQYERLVAKFEGDFVHHKTCQHCIAARAWIEKVCGGYVVNYVHQELVDHWQEDIAYHSVWLGRAIINLRRGWKRADGSLAPVLGPPPDPMPELMAAHS